MAAGFVGLTVIVTLNSPPGTVLQGLVDNVQDQRLFLHNVIFPQNGRYIHEYVIHGSEITDIEVAPSRTNLGNNPSTGQFQPQPHHNELEYAYAHAPSAFRSRQTTQPAQNFVDPAILSYNRTPEPTRVPADPLVTLNAPLSSLSIRQPAEADTELEGDAGLINKPLSLVSQGEIQGSASARSKRQHYKKTREQHTHAQPQDSSSPEVPRGKLHKAGKEDGWRKTPILQETIDFQSQGLQVPTTAEQSSTKRKNKGRTRRDRPAQKSLAQNGWATEDATDVQEMGDFDFEGNLSKFDKRAIFDQLRSEDTVAYEDRLVSHNQVGNVGTFGGKNYHPLENVLERPRQGEELSGSADSEQDVEEVAHSRPMRRAMSRNSARQQPPSRKDSGNLVETLPSSASYLNRPLNRTKYSSSSQPPTSPKMQRTASPGSTAMVRTSSALRKPALRYSETDRICPTIHAGFLEDVEAVALDDLGINADIITENAARGIADVALSAINPSSRRMGQSGNPQPVIVVLVGPETFAGARAIAAARHLRERRITMVLSLAWPASNSGVLRPQLSRFEGDVLNWKETAAFLKTLDAPPELIIDGLFGLSESLANLTSDQVKTIMEMIRWANMSRASVLCVDLPSGVDCITGQVEVKEGEPAEVRAKFVVCCGAPCQGLLRALELRQEDGDNWRVYVCDIGINPAWRLALKKSRDKRNHKGINFLNGWVLALRFDSGAS